MPWVCDSVAVHDDTVWCGLQLLECAQYEGQLTERQETGDIGKSDVCFRPDDFHSIEHGVGEKHYRGAPSGLLVRDITSCNNIEFSDAVSDHHLLCDLSLKDLQLNSILQESTRKDF